MTENTNYYNVKNRSSSMVVYTIPEMNIRREFAPAETKRLSFEELEKLTYQPGGRALLANFLQFVEPVKVLNQATTDLGIHTEPEYNMSEEDIKKMLVSGSVDQLLDALDFAPVGVIDLIKAYAVSLPVKDYDKREAIKEKTGFDVSKALENDLASKENETVENAVPQRRVPVATTTEEAAPARRTTPNYNVVSGG